MRSLTKPLAAALLAATIALTAAGCGSSHKATNTGGSGGSGGTSVTTPTTAQSSGYGY